MITKWSDVQRYNNLVKSRVSMLVQDCRVEPYKDIHFQCQETEVKADNS